MSCPKTSTRPSSSVSSPQTSRMSVDLPEPLATEDPVDVAALEAHRHIRDRRDRLLLPADHEPLADAVDDEGGHAGARAVEATGPSSRSSVRDSGLRSRCDSRWIRWTVGVARSAEMTRAAGLPTTCRVGGPRGSGACAPVEDGGHQKSRGPDLAHGSWFVRWRSCRLRSSSRWAQISHARRPKDRRDVSSEKEAISSCRDPSVAGWDAGREVASRAGVYAPVRADVNPRRTIGRTGLGLVPLAALGDGEVRPLEHAAACRGRRWRQRSSRLPCRPDRPPAWSPRGPWRSRCGVEQGRRDALPADLPRHDEADDRPDRRVVDRRQDLRVGEAAEVLARPEAHPADGPFVVVGDAGLAAMSSARQATASSARLPSAVEFVQSRPRIRK